MAPLRGHGSMTILMTAAVATLYVLVAAAPARSHELRWRDERQHIKRRAKEEVGAPYRSGGESPRGFDCSGFTRWTYEGHGADLPHSAIDQFRLAHRRGYKRIWKRSRLHVGDLVFHKTTSARVGHAGIYIGHGRFISATSSDGVRVESLHDPYYWGRRWVGATRLPVTMRP
ncbi:MAG TPA: C40 family peptidase [Actinomycetota bacterium]|nr:C40 family peptidase [Actinomycetota bacterium]